MRNRPRPRASGLPAGAVPAETERQFQDKVLTLARLHKWRWFHCHDSRRSPAGFPDLVLVRGSKLLFRELKTATGRASAAQLEWLESLQRAGQDARVWRPADWASIVAELR